LAALQGLGASGSNSAFIGYPIVLQVIGPSAGVALALCTLVENLLVMPLALAMADSGGGGKRPGDVLMSVLRSLLRNPMILAIFAGLFVSALGWGMPSVLDQTVSLAAAAASPTALFVIGGSLVGLQLTGIRGDIALIACGKLLLHPLCVLVFVFLFPPEQPLLRAAAILFAAMPMLSIYPVLAQRHGHERLCAAALLAATVSSFVSISLLIALLPPAWLPAH
jgi:malonate transporter and related proteins